MADIEDFREKTSRAFYGELVDHSPSIVILSNEHCSSRLRTVAEIARLGRFLRSYFSSITIVAYLRNPGDSLRSAYSTAIKTGSTAEFGYPDADEISRKYDYDGILTRWENEFSSENLDVRLYDELDQSPGGVVGDFASRLPIPDLSDVLVTETAKNISLSRFAIEFLREMNRYIPYELDGRMNPIRGNLHELVEQFDPGPPFEGDRTVISALVEAMSDANARVRLRYFPDMPPPLFKLPAKANELESDSPRFTKEAIQLIAQLWEAKQGQVLQLRRQIEQARKHQSGRSEQTIDAKRR